MESSLSLLSPSSSSRHHWKYHVFPSFHGPDVRRNLLCHFLEKFKCKGINAFVDNDMERSKPISHELKEAIRGSKIAIVFLSKNYASSTWCLNELVEIMDCGEKLSQIVLSLFYEVDPTDVKKQTGDFGEVFKTTCIGKTEEDVRRWKHALTEVAQIAGYHSTKWENDTKMTEEIATDVSKMLNNSTPSNDFDRLVGMESQMKKMGPLLQLDSNEVKTIGIVGPSGIGKTTIARYLFNQHSQDFQLSVFVDNIKTRYPIPACSDDYIVKLNLHKQLMSQLTNEVGIKIPHLGIAEDRCKDKKVLVVLDDLDRSVQLEAMAKETWFGHGSRIIVTTQDRKILKASGIKHIYEVDLPSDDEALQMFCNYVFGQTSPKDGITELASEVMSLVGRLPLRLRVMGSCFRGMCKEDWRKSLTSLKTLLDLDGEIEILLKFSYDALCDENKRLFLHIACFFNDERVDIVEGCLASCFLDVTKGLRVLAEKSLIEVDGGIIKMQELLVKLGRKIEREQSVSDLGKRQFLNDATDIGDILNNDKADSSSVLGINDLDGNTTCTSERVFERLSILWFQKKERLSNLQFLRIRSYGINPRSLNSIYGKLRFLEWPKFGMPHFPSSFNPKFLVKLVMHDSQLEKMWKKIQPLYNLKWMDLSGSYWLKELPDLSTATNLYVLNLRDCSSLVKLPSSIGNATNLQRLDLSYCSSLVDLPSSIGNATNLQILNLCCCKRLVELPSSIGNAITNLQRLDLSYCSNLVELPSSIGNAIHLQDLYLTHCSRLVELPSSIGNAITNLQRLDLSYCKGLVEIPSSIGNGITNLQILDLSYCSSLVELPSSIENATNLQRLDLGFCKSLVELPSSIGNAITNLQRLDLSYCTSLVELPSSIGNAINLKKLDLSHCSNLVELPSSIGNAINLMYLNLNNCWSLIELPSSIGNTTNLQRLVLNDCWNLMELPSSMRTLRKLLSLELEHCSKLEVLLANINLESLEELNLSSCSLLKSYPESSTNIQDLNPSGTTVKEGPSEMCEIQELGPWIGRISCLRRLVLSGMKNLVSLPQLPYSVVELEADNCESLERLDCSFLNPGIRLLNFGNCFKLNQESRDLIIQTPTNQYAVLPGEEVPQCFTYRSSGGTLTVNLNQKPLGTSTKFKACIVCANGDVVIGSKLVSCSIKSKENAFTSIKAIRQVFLGNLYTFEVEAEEVTSTELVFEFDIYTYNLIGKWEIKECGILQILEVPSC